MAREHPVHSSRPVRRDARQRPCWLQLCRGSVRPEARSLLRSRHRTQHVMVSTIDRCESERLPAFWAVAAGGHRWWQGGLTLVCCIGQAAHRCCVCAPVDCSNDPHRTCAGDVSCGLPCLRPWQVKRREHSERAARKLCWRILGHRSLVCYCRGLVCNATPRARIRHSQRGDGCRHCGNELPSRRNVTRTLATMLTETH